MTEPDQGNGGGLLLRVVRIFSPSREHTVTSAALLLMAATLLSRVVGYLRDAYVAYAFGAGPVTDSYIAAFTLPDLLNYMASGGAISISFISIYTRYIAEKREDEARQAFSVIVSIMVVVFTLLVGIGELVTPWFVRWWFPGFTFEQSELCIRLTRILLPAQLFFLIGGVVSAVQQTHRRFLLPAFAPIIYSVFIILGGVLFSQQAGVASLAVGAVIGSFAGPFLLNAWGAHRTGTGYRFSFQPSNPAFREWLWMSIPLMLGVSIIVADDWIMRYFASSGDGAITRLNYAKRLLQVPIGVLGQAVGVASLPFFARLYNEKSFERFAETVNSSITRLGGVCLLVSAWMIAAAYPIVDIAFRHGRFQSGDAHQTAIYFTWFSVSLIFWAVQGLYARAFYAAGDMARPMIAATLVTLASLAVYASLYRQLGVTGLAIASNIAILAHTITLAILLHRQKLVLITGLGWAELGKALFIACVALVISSLVGDTVEMDQGRSAIIVRFALVTLTWAGAVVSGLWITRSRLLQILQRS